MNSKQFEALVQRLEPFAQKNPGAYKLQVALLAVLGYAYLLGIIAVAIGLFLLLLAVVFYLRHASAGMGKVMVVLLLVPLVVFQSMWVKIPQPDGLELDRSQVPELFGLIDELTQKLNALKVHRVLLTGEFNAAVSQVPRFGLFGWSQSYLILGLPLLQSLSPKQFKAVLAHELGHLSGNHSRFSAWIYRLCCTWTNVLSQLSSQEESSWLLDPFINWYAPFFKAYSFVLARADEYEADRCSCELTSARTMAAALINMEVRAQFLDQLFWQPLYQQANYQAEPPAHCFTQLAQTLQSPPAPKRLKTWLAQSLNQDTDYTDTHPCLRDRLAACGYSPNYATAFLKSLTLSSADRYLGSALPTLCEQLSQTWQTNINFAWHERYSVAQEQRQTLAILAQKASPLNPAERWSQVELTYALENSEVVQPLLTAFLQDYPDHGYAYYLQGELLLAIEDPNGLQYLKKAARKDPACRLEAYQSIYGFLTKQGRKAEAKTYRKRLEKIYERLTLAQAERDQLQIQDQFSAADSSPEAQETLIQQLANHPIQTAYLVQKILQYFPERPLYVLLIKRQRSWIEFGTIEKNAILLKALSENLGCPGETLILLETEEHKALCQKIRKVAGDPIYSQA
jgi:Zn-dependent protease with chaperone function